MMPPSLLVGTFVIGYTIAWLLNLARLFKGQFSPILSRLPFFPALVGVAAHTLYIGQRAVAMPATSFDWYIVAAWVVANAYLYFSYYEAKAPFGLLLMPMVLGLSAVAWLYADDQPFPEDRVSLIWGRVHGGFLLAGTVAVIIGFAAGVLYLLQDYRLRKHIPAWTRFQLPSLEHLEHINSRMIVVAVMMLAAGFLAGVILNIVNHGRRVDELPWRDPVIWSSSILVLWMIAAAIFNVIYRPARQGRKVAYLTVASFFFLLIVIGLQLLFPSAHSGSKTPTMPASHVLSEASFKTVSSSMGGDT